MERTEQWQWVGALPFAVTVQTLKTDVQVIACTASAGADAPNDGSGLYRHSLLGVNLTEMTVEASHGSMVKDDIVAVTGVAAHRFHHDSRQHGVDDIVATLQINAIMELPALGEGV